MKKIFTLFAAGAVAMAANAQDNVFKSTGEPVAAGTVLVDNENLTVTTVYDSKGGKPEAPVTICGEEFTGWFQLRVDADPNADNLTGDQTDGSTPLIVEVKKSLTFTIFDRRQKGNQTEPNDNGFNAGDNKGILAMDQATAKKVPGTIEFSSYDGDPDAYAFCAEAFEFEPGTYTIYRKGSTMRIFGFSWAVDVTDVPADALMSWDFTKWSEATVANLMEGTNWSDIEKADATEPTEASKDKCFWQVSYAEGLSPERYLMANNLIIGELEGLVYTNEKTNRSLAIAVDYPETSLGTYHGPAYLWLGSKEINYFIIPGVPAGATIKIGVESHKTTDARGVILSVNDEILTAPDGSEVALPTTYTEQEWLVPATAAESNDVQIRNTNGCHLYFITVTAGSGTTGIEAVANDENAPVEYYNLQGVRVANPENGLYIKRQGNKAVKVIVK